MYAALQQLGFRPWHVAEAMHNPARSFSLANEAVNASYFPKEGERPYGRAEFDRWIGEYDATLDIPMNLLTPELLRAYPSAKVILTTRDSASWRRSIKNTVIPISNSTKFRLLSYFSASCAAYMSFVDAGAAAMDGWSEDAFIAHGRKVRDVVPADQLLEFRMGQDGWKELCEFLGTETPEGDFLKLNTSESGLFGVVTNQFWQGMALDALRKGLLGAAPVILVGVAIWWGRR
ncbi:hypothetical protein MBLNU459_g6374t1 [Dothideomycetes sp. NU459]